MRNAASIRHSNSCIILVFTLKLNKINYNIGAVINQMFSGIIHGRAGTTGYPEKKNTKRAYSFTFKPTYFNID